MILLGELQSSIFHYREDLISGEEYSMPLVFTSRNDHTNRQGYNNHFTEHQPLKL